MSDDVIEDEANERDIRRIRRARLAATDDWCDDCHGYTHMPYCPAYVEPAGNKHKGDVMERRFEYQELGGKHGIFEGNLLVAVVGECFARPESAGDVAREMARVWNEHDALVEQRDLLVAALRPFAALDIDAFDHLRDKPDDWNVYQMNETMVTLGDVRRARHALAIVEQGHEMQAGRGGSER